VAQVGTIKTGLRSHRGPMAEEEEEEEEEEAVHRIQRTENT
jgi:hypothetical protein